MQASRRTHIVMIPGFGGFDALGQIFYYAGVTTAFNAWRARQPAEAPAAQSALHYFDNLPTAGVRTRAMALRAFLEERVLRHDFQASDRLALVGHSTGGLDIRQLLVNINPALPPTLSHLSDRTTDPLVSDAEIFGKIERLAFLSVPQRGTNIAAFAGRFRALLSQFIASELATVKLTHNLPLDRFEQWLNALTEQLQPMPQLFLAVRDTLWETLQKSDPKSPTERYSAALSRAAYGELVGWLENVQNDFFAIDDLAFERRDNAPPTPAHYPEDLRRSELDAWNAARIRTLSYATLGRQPNDREPRTEPYELWSLPQLLGTLRSDSAGTDPVYRLVYALTAAGNFSAPADTYVVDPDGRSRRLAPWENDGIVNTASMLWPNAEATRVVAGDHGDIIGHYVLGGQLKPAERALGRRYHSYDIFGSNSGFDQARFERVWSDVFEFCTT